MLEQLQEILCEYIEESRVCSITYNGRTFVAEPYLLFESKNGNLYLHGWKVFGEYEKTPPPHWMSIQLDYIENITGLGEFFIAPMVGYKPRSKAFHKVLYEWKNTK